MSSGNVKIERHLHGNTFNLQCFMMHIGPLSITPLLADCGGVPAAVYSFINFLIYTFFKINIQNSQTSFSSYIQGALFCIQLSQQIMLNMCHNRLFCVTMLYI